MRSLFGRKAPSLNIVNPRLRRHNAALEGTELTKVTVVESNDPSDTRKWTYRPAVKENRFASLPEHSIKPAKVGTAVSACRDRKCSNRSTLPPNPWSHYRLDVVRNEVELSRTKGWRTSRIASCQMSKWEILCSTPKDELNNSDC